MDRDKVWFKRFNLKTTDIWVREDLSKETEKERQLLLPAFKAAKAAKIKCHFKGENLIIDGKKYAAKDIDRMPENLQKYDSTRQHSQQDDQFVFFYGRHSPFSNFHMANFTVNGTTYSSTEKFYQSHKANHFNDDEIHSKIMNSEDPVEIMKLGRQVKGYNEEAWMAEPGKQAMFVGNLEKFTQNPHLSERLIATGERLLVEANPHDPVWGIGMSMTNPLSKSQDHWKGQNYMGQILSQVREAVRTSAVRNVGIDMETAPFH